MFRRVLVAIFLGAVISYNAPQAPCWSLKHFGQGHVEFIAAAAQLIKDNVPEWYQEEVEIGLDLSAPHLAYTYRNKKGDIAIKITQRGLDACPLEDFSSILLHEYVHAKIWERVLRDFPDVVCNNVRHELEANWAVLQAYDALDYTPHMLSHAMELYNRYYLEGIIFCDPAVLVGVPTPPPLPTVP